MQGFEKPSADINTSHTHKMQVQANSCVIIVLWSHVGTHRLRVEGCNFIIIVLMIFSLVYIRSGIDKDMGLSGFRVMEHELGFHQTTKGTFIMTENNSLC